METKTIKMLSGYQIEELRAYFAISSIERIGICIETGEMFLECSPMYNKSVPLETVKVPLIPENKTI
jgi:hypothetical protein